jgi:hypothetical protein
MGLVDPPSYIQVLVRELTGVMLDQGTADGVAIATLAAVTALGVTLHVRDRLLARAAAAAHF